MIITWKDIKNFAVQDIPMAFTLFKEEARRQKKELIYIITGHPYRLLRTEMMELCDKVIFIQSKEAEWSFNIIIKDRYSNNQGRYISDNELLVYIRHAL